MNENELIHRSKLVKFLIIIWTKNDVFKKQNQVTFSNFPTWFVFLEVNGVRRDFQPIPLDSTMLLRNRQKLAKICKILWN